MRTENVEMMVKQVADLNDKLAIGDIEGAKSVAIALSDSIDALKGSGCCKEASENGTEESPSAA